MCFSKGSICNLEMLISLERAGVETHQACAPNLSFFMNSTREKVFLHPPQHEYPQNIWSLHPAVLRYWRFRIELFSDRSVSVTPCVATIQIQQHQKIFIFWHMSAKSFRYLCPFTKILVRFKKYHIWYGRCRYIDTSHFMLYIQMCHVWAPFNKARKETKKSFSFIFFAEKLQSFWNLLLIGKWK